jgi:DNA-directed RNA polymerase specialized sigma24 family protein
MDVNQLFINHDKWLRDLAFRNISRLLKVGYPIDIDELYSIFCEVFMDCVSNKWDEEKGKLTTYLFYACNNKVSDMLDKYFRMEVNTKRECEFVIIDDSGSEINGIESFAQQSNNDLDEYELIQALLEEAKHLSPFARLLLEYTLNPPDFIERELQAQEAKHDLSLTMEDTATYRRRPLNLSFVIHVLSQTSEGGIPRNRITKVKREIEKAIIAVTM